MPNAGLRGYREVLRLVRRLPTETRPYYAKYARENFVNYRDLLADDDLAALLRRAYTHSSWVLSKVVRLHVLNLAYLPAPKSTAAELLSKQAMLAWLSCSTRSTRRRRRRGSRLLVTATPGGDARKVFDHLPLYA
ncbi:LYR motif-containing protein [Panicum miliaceum]|uniref:LYR motif-containing protein n=1 Tax=Panicum miliaceum TaxID=4540 RepID=A0A3L6T6W7_PANMI|nr:LYR motif-containing protein [Panicum miliaceum]